MAPALIIVHASWEAMWAHVGDCMRDAVPGWDRKRMALCLAEVTPKAEAGNTVMSVYLCLTHSYQIVCRRRLCHLVPLMTVQQVSSRI